VVRAAHDADREAGGGDDGEQEFVTRKLFRDLKKCQS
jgi:hypothetical protein